MIHSIVMIIEGLIIKYKDIWEFTLAVVLFFAMYCVGYLICYLKHRKDYMKGYTKGVLDFGDILESAIKEKEEKTKKEVQDEIT